MKSTKDLLKEYFRKSEELGALEKTILSGEHLKELENIVLAEIKKRKEEGDSDACYLSTLLNKNSVYGPNIDTHWLINERTNRIEVEFDNAWAEIICSVSLSIDDI